MTPITYPARPIKGGDFTKAPAKNGDWRYEPKYNGWRALIHVASETMFNRHGEKLSIEAEFRTALSKLRKVAGTDLPWLDCEVLGRRHELGRGSLIVLDAPIEGTYLERRAKLLTVIPWQLYSEPPETNSVGLAPSHTADHSHTMWGLVQILNRRWSCQFYEGLVAKKSDSKYPVQLRSPSETFPFWVKHRWQF